MSNIENFEAKDEANSDTAKKQLAVLVKKLIGRGKAQGFLTYDEINASIPSDNFSSEIFDQVVTSLSDAGINLVENVEEISEEEEEFDIGLVEDSDDLLEENAVVEEVNRTDDPVKMYLRDMGGVELLSREGEIEIAKRIEEGREVMIKSLCETPLTLKQFKIWYEALLNEKIYLREIIDLEANYGSEAT